INVALIAATVLIFIQQLIVPDQEIFIQTYALVPSLVNFGDFATMIPFITAIFLHGGFLHIISNMWFLWIFGDNVEGRFGWFFFPIVYFLSGIAGNFLQYFVMPSSSIPMLGASGAVAGVLGAYYVLFPHSRIKTIVPFFGFASVVEIPAPFMLGYWFILQLISGTVSLPFMGESGGVAFFAHVGGFLTGVLFAKISGLFRLHPEA
ncbi:rhomboid family intramembrane serine protease, partial [Candidatus Daviesbacteria bacterium]|nr:rhomboid family intramembrane serine protease [Candidatus Daviesbacteria bacterium]